MMTGSIRKIRVSMKFNSLCHQLSETCRCSLTFCDDQWWLLCILHTTAITAIGSQVDKCRVQVQQGKQAL